MVETHWRINSRVMSIPDYTLYSRFRPLLEKKGGGLAVLISNKISAYEWAPDAQNTTDWRASSELMWIVIEGTSGRIAIGVTYLATGNSTTNWNLAIHEAILNDISELRSINCEILLLGDFNGHVELNLDGSLAAKDPNGLFLLSLSEQHQMYHEFLADLQREVDMGFQKL